MCTRNQVLQTKFLLVCVLLVALHVPLPAAARTLRLRQQQDPSPAGRPRSRVLAIAYIGKAGYIERFPPTLTISFRWGGAALGIPKGPPTAEEPAGNDTETTVSTADEPSSTSADGDLTSIPKPPSIPPHDFAASGPCIPTPPSLTSWFRVFALGDSITQGAVPSLKDNHPYAMNLAALLSQNPGGVAQVVVEGNGGAGVFEKGFDSNGTVPETADVYLSDGPYNAAVVLVGINDLLRGGHAAEAIMERLGPLYKKILEGGSPVVAVPPFAAPGFTPKTDPKEAERVKLVELIGAYVASYNEARTASQPPMYFLNAQAGPLDFWGMSEADRDVLMDDGLHLSMAGYDKLGDIIHELLVSKLCNT